MDTDQSVAVLILLTQQRDRLRIEVERASDLLHDHRATIDAGYGAGFRISRRPSYQILAGFNRVIDDLTEQIDTLRKLLDTDAEST